MNLFIRQALVVWDEAWKIRVEEPKDVYKEVDGVLHYQELFFVPETIRFELICQYHDDLLAGHFGINKTRKLFGQKYY